jgi:hypothetical protein
MTKVVRVTASQSIDHAGPGPIIHTGTCCPNPAPEPRAGTHTALIACHNCEKVIAVIIADVRDDDT